MKTLIAIPCLDMVNVEFVKSFMDMRKLEGTAYTFVIGTLIYEGRNLIANNAIQHGFDRVMWIDSDMIIPPYALERLTADMDAGRDFVTGLYFSRKPPIKPVVYGEVYWRVRDDGNVETGSKRIETYPENRVFPVQGAGFGCCMTSVELLKALVDKYGSPFTPLMGLGEDLAFCWRASQMGYKLYCDTGIKCGHIGSHVYGESDAWISGR